MPRSPIVLPDAVYQKSLDCVHCGLCLSSCPTYLATGRETSSPRGRIYLMRGVAEGRIAGGEVLAEEAYLCLGCRACETACPSGVDFGGMLELTRESVVAAGWRDGPAGTFERWILRQIVPRPARLRALVWMLEFVQRLRLDRLAMPFLPNRIRKAHAQMPEIPPARARRALPAFTPAEGERRGQVAFFVGCVMPEIFGAVNRATVQVLAQNGFDVVVPANQGCCGALQAHSGDLETARQLARRNAEVFGGGQHGPAGSGGPGGPDQLDDHATPSDSTSEFEALIVNSAGCGAAMREAPQWIGAEGQVYAGRVRDIAEFLDEVGFRPPRRAAQMPTDTESRELRVCYDDPCHLVHGQGVRDAPRRLLAQVPGLKLIDHFDPTACCGAAGIYNLTHPEMSQSVLERKLDSLEAARPDVIASGNPGCLMQLANGARQRGIKARIVHPVELLVASLERER